MFTTGLEPLLKHAAAAAAPGLLHRAVVRPAKILGLGALTALAGKQLLDYNKDQKYKNLVYAPMTGT